MQKIPALSLTKIPRTRYGSDEDDSSSGALGQLRGYLP